MPPTRHTGTRGVWETGGSLIVFTIGDSVTKGKLDGDDLTLYLYEMTSHYQAHVSRSL